MLGLVLRPLGLTLEVIEVAHGAVGNHKALGGDPEVTVVDPESNRFHW